MGNPYLEKKSRPKFWLGAISPPLTWISLFLHMIPAKSGFSTLKQRTYKLATSELLSTDHTQKQTSFSTGRLYFHCSSQPFLLSTQHFDLTDKSLSQREIFVGVFQPILKAFGQGEFWKRSPQSEVMLCCCRFSGKSVSKLCVPG
jgi:hypothetical protein